jgi:hypothetical protein
MLYINQDSKKKRFLNESIFFVEEMLDALIFFQEACENASFFKISLLIFLRKGFIKAPSVFTILGTNIIFKISDLLLQTQYPVFQ